MDILDTHETTLRHSPGIVEAVERYYVHPVALPLLNDKSKPVVDELADLMTRERIRCSIPNGRLEIAVHVDSDSGRKLIHIKQTVPTDAEQAMEYWDRLSAPIDQWVNSLSEDEADIVQNEIFMTVHWNNHVSP